jgi:hypothetical protein
VYSKISQHIEILSLFENLLELVIGATVSVFFLRLALDPDLEFEVRDFDRLLTELIEFLERLDSGFFEGIE